MHTFDPATLGLSDAPDFTLHLANESATRRLGAAIAEACRDGAYIALVGDLGAGKTTLTQGLVGALDPDAEVVSPTYTLLNEYATKPRVYHFDLYRLESVGELETVAYWDYAEDEDAIVLVEWLDRIPAAFLRRGIVVHLTHETAGRCCRIWDIDGRDIEAILLASGSDLS